MISDKFRLNCSGLLVLYLVGLILYLTGFATDYWKESRTTHAGVWRSCFLQESDSTWNCDNLEVDYYDDWKKAVVAFLILGLISAVIGGFTYMFVPLSASLQVLTGVFTTIAVAVYGAETTTSLSLEPVTLGWSFYVTIAGGALLLINGIILLALLCKEDEFTMQPILPKSSQTKVGALEGYPMQSLHSYS